MKIALYGGSFDPVHAGHVGLVRRAIAELGPDKVIVLPAARNPLKSGSQSPWDRAELVRRAFAGIDRVSVDERELRRGGMSYAIDTVREIAAENPGAELYFLIGEDSVKDLPRWKDYELLKTLCRFAVFPRTVESSTEIRRRLAAGEALGALVPAPVAAALAQTLDPATKKGTST